MSHIALLLPELEAGGAQRVMLLLAREFAARGHRVDLVLLQAAGPLLNTIPEGVRLVDLAARSYGVGQIGLLLTAVWRLVSWLNREHPEVLLSTITGANLVALLARRRTHFSLRIVIREAVTLKNVGNSLRLWAMRWLYPQADAVVALSSVMASELVEQIGVAANRVHSIYNPVDAEFIWQQARMPLSHRWLNDASLKVVIAVGRLIPQKDYATLLRAFVLLPQALSARLIIVGEGAERTILEHLAAELKISDRIELVGFDENPWRWMARADLFVLSSRWEGHPNALLEAMVIELPVVATEYDVSVHSIATRYGFEVVPVGEARGLAREIKRLLKRGIRQKYLPAEEISEKVAAYLDVIAGKGTTPG